MHVVFEPKNMSPDDLQKVFFQMWQKSYTTKKILKRLTAIFCNKDSEAQNIRTEVKSKDYKSRSDR